MCNTFAIYFQIFVTSGYKKVKNSDMKGPFIPLLKLVNSLEREPDIGYAMLRFSHKSGQEPLVSLDIDLIQLTLNE